MTPGSSSSASSESSAVSRALFNSLPGRFSRAAIKSVKNSVLLPVYLSPWGDGSPIEVPNVRKRDIALFPLVAPWEVGDQVLGISAVKADPYTSEIVELSGDESMLQAGHGHHFLARLPLEPPPFLSKTPEARTTIALANKLLPNSDSVASSGSICTIRSRIRHRFVDAQADLRFYGERPSESWFGPLGTSKGWFAPYLHATNRCPYIPRLPYLPRTSQPSLVIVDGPPLYRDGDYSLASDLVQTVPWVMDFCPTAGDPRDTEFRIAILLVGIAPPAPLIGWSSSRRPGECLMDFSLPNMVPCILLPAAPNAPVIAYDAHTLADVLNPVCTLTPSSHADYLLEYLRLVVDTSSISNARMESYVRRAIECLVGCMRKCGTIMGKSRISSRAGIVFLKVPSTLVHEMDGERSPANSLRRKESLQSL